jgi:NitT/TauT family transport system substrate-binding protein
LAKGIYKKYGIDLTVRMGGPQVNAQQSLLAGQADLTWATISPGAHGHRAGRFDGDRVDVVPERPAGHGDVASLGSLNGKRSLVATAGRSTW